MAVTFVRSGGQTGADQGGLSAAVLLGLGRGGWIPKGRRTQAGRLSDGLFKLYRLREHASASYLPRTEANVVDSQGTVLFGNMESPGCKATIKFCVKHGRPYAINPSQASFKQWLSDNRIEHLNVAGNREESTPGIFVSTRDFLLVALR